MNQNFDLSICIATYNRANYISETLNSIVAQLLDNVEVVIVDGASTDNTKEVVSIFVDKYPNFKYYLLDNKGGVDKDYDIAVQLSKGRMCWLFTDDDLIKDGAISQVLSKINQNFGLIILNAETKNIDFSRSLLPKILQIDNDIVYTENEFDNFFLNTIDYLSFIGCVIIDRQIWLNRERKTYYGSEFIHVGVIFQKKLHTNIFISHNPYIIIRIGNEQWSVRSFEIWIFKWPRLISSFSNLSLKVRSKYSLQPSLNRFKNIIIQRARSSYNYELYKKWFSTEKSPFIWKSSLYILSKTPILFFKVIIYVTIKSKKFNGN
jgi:glycosyltransferase involved in cell wall biosynthesis